MALRGLSLTTTRVSFTAVGHVSSVTATMFADRQLGVICDMAHVHHLYPSCQH